MFFVVVQIAQPIMHASAIRRSLAGLVPPKIATPNAVVRLADPDVVRAKADNLVFWLYVGPNGPGRRVLLQAPQGPDPGFAATGRNPGTILREGQRQRVSRHIRSDPLCNIAFPEADGRVASWLAARRGQEKWRIKERSRRLRMRIIVGDQGEGKNA